MLDSNERWVSKVIAPELREKIAEPTTGRATIEEQYMIRGYIIYPHIITMLQKSMSDLEFAHVALKGVITRCLEQIMFTVSDDFHALKRELKRRGIKVEDDIINDEVYYYRFWCRGIEDRLGFVREALRTEVINILTSYTGDLGRELRKPSTKELTH